MKPIGTDQMAVWAETAFRKGIRKGIRKANESRRSATLKAQREQRERCQQLKAEIAAMSYDLGARTPEERNADRMALERISLLGRSFGGVHGANRGGVTPGLS